MASSDPFHLRVCIIDFGSRLTHNVFRIGKGIVGKPSLGRPKAHHQSFGQNKAGMNGPKAIQFMRYVHFDVKF